MVPPRRACGDSPCAGADIGVALDAWLAARRRVPFCWGRADCALFPADWVLAATGQDLAAWFRGRYADEAGALAALRRFAGGGLAETARALLGPPLPSPLLARRGDVVLLREPPAPGAAPSDSLGVCAGHVIAYQAAPRGVGTMPLERALAAWRLPGAPGAPG